MLQSKFKNWVNAEVEKKLDQQRFSSLPLRMRIGIGLLISSYTIGYGFPVAILIFSGINHRLSSGLLSGSIVYSVCWVVGAVGLSLAGRECIKYPIFFSAKLIKTIFPKYFEVGNQSVPNAKIHRSISQFQLITLLSLIGLLLTIIFSLRFASKRILIIGIIIIFCIHQAYYIHGMFSASSNFFIKTIKGKEFFNNQQGILFRFDDGPDPNYTPQILDILKSEGIQALFAVTGINAERYPEIVERIYREKHFIANHTYSHPLNILFLNYSRIKNEMTSTNQIIQNIIGEKPKYFCPPMGFKNPVIGKAAEELGLIPVMWDIKTWDTKVTFERIMAVIVRKLKSPAIIMFHDAIMPWSKKDRESTVLAVKETIRVLKEKKYI